MGRSSTEQVIQRGCETSVVGDMQNLVGQGPEKPDLTLNQQLTLKLVLL